MHPTHILMLLWRICHILGTTTDTLLLTNIPTLSWFPWFLPNAHFLFQDPT